MKLRSGLTSASVPIAEQRGHSVSFKEKIAVWVISLLLITINIIRIFRVPITHDEAPAPEDLLTTYGAYVHLSKVTANTHLLNSILRKFFIETFSNSPFFLRLDSLLALIVFLVWGYGIAAKIFENKWWRIAGFLLLTLNPFLFEFWGLSRGYGLAIALMTGSIYYFLCYLQHNRLSWLAWSLLAGIGAVYSNFSLLNFLLALSGFIFIQGLFLRKEPYTVFLKRELPVLAGAGVLTYLLIATPIRKLVAAGELYYGGDNGLIADTISSVVQESMYLGGDQLQTVAYVTWLVTAVMVLVLAYWFVIFLNRKKREPSQTGLLLSCLLFVSLASLVLQHELLGTKYLINRTALFLYVLFIWAVLITLYQFRKKAVTLIILFLFTGLSAYNFYENITLSRSRMWWTDNYNLVVLNRILKNKDNPTKKISLRVNWIFMPSLNYYIYTRYPNDFEPLLYIQDPPGLDDTTYDYLYLKGDDMSTVSPKYELDTAFETGFQLLKKKKQ